MEDRTRYSESVLNMTPEEFSRAWKAGEIQTILLEELDMDMNTMPAIIEHNTNQAIQAVRNIAKGTS